MSDITAPELTWEAQRRDGTWEKIGTGLSRGVVPEGSSFSHAFEGSLGGPSVANFILSDKQQRGRPDLEHFTPVVARSGAVPVFSGRVIRTPEVRGDRYQRHVEVQGWKNHTKDDPIDKTWLVSDLSQWRDARSYTTCPLATYTTGWAVGSSGGALTIAVPNGAAATNATAGAVVYDAGPNNKIAQIVLTYEGGTAANLQLNIAGHDTLFTGAETDVMDATPILAGPTTDTFTFASPRRYVLIQMVSSAAITGGDTAWLKVTSALLFTDATDELSNASDLHTSTIISETLDAACPKFDYDRTGITATSFDIPEFYAPWMYPNAIIDAVNAYHGYQVLFSADPTSRVTYRAIPTTPLYAVGKQDQYTFDNPSTYDGADVFSRVVGKYTDATGVPGVVEAGGVREQYGQALTFTNPSIETNTTGWSEYSGTGTIARSTAQFYSGVASMTLTTDIGQTNVSVTPTNAASIVGRCEVGSVYALRFYIRKTSACSAATVNFLTNSFGYFLETGNQSVNIFSRLATNVWCEVELLFVATHGLALAGLTIALTGTANTLQAYTDLFEIGGDTTHNVVRRRGFTKTQVVDFRSRMTAAAAQQIVNTIYTACQTPPLKGTLKVTGHIRRHGTGANIHVSQLKLGEPILLEDEQDPNTGAIGRVGIIMAFTYDHDTQTATITIDSNKNFVENLLARIGAFQ